MTPFDYVSVLISIILGLGITQIMTGVADLVHQWNKVKLYWPHLLWIVLVFILHIQEWWETYQLHDFDEWRLPTFLFLSLYPVTLFILARILFPFNVQDGPIDLKEFYYANFRKFFISTMILTVLSIASNIIVRGFMGDQIIQISLFCILGLVTIKNYRKEWVHQLIAIAMLATFIAGFIVNWNSWIIK
ncbi:MAG: hypothetical protein HOP08_02970 [Cyclobacteriaceae bacterium]|nr:hypothetical protein [Cyclobacteriaceae bacterium]